MPRHHDYRLHSRVNDQHEESTDAPEHRPGQSEHRVARTESTDSPSDVVSAAQPAPASVAEEIERQVAERTADLAAANDRLRREVEIHQRTADALRASEAGVRLLVDGIPALAVALSASGAIEHANQPTLTYFGVDFDEFKARIGRDLIHPHDIARSTQIFDESIAAGVPCEIEHRLQRFDGVHRWHLTRAMPLRDASGRIEHWYVLNTDIDERKRVEDQLRVRELSARLLVESMESIPAFAIVANEVGEIVYANRQVLEYYGRTLEEVKAWPTSVHIVHPDGRIIPFDTYNLFYRDEKAKLLDRMHAATLTPLNMRGVAMMR